MMLLEHDAKNLLAHAGVPVPDGVWAAGDAPPPALPASLRDGPWVVKAQIPAGGRGKAGGIRVARDVAELASMVGSLGRGTLKGFPVQGCRIEATIRDAREIYFALMVDAGRAAVQILYAADGGVEIEHNHDLMRRAAAPDAASVRAELDALIATQPAAFPEPVRPVLHRLVETFFAREATLLEINPLFLTQDGKVFAGDCKWVCDSNSFERQPEVAAVVRDHPERYPEAACKLHNGFDYVVLDSTGDIALLTSGAGLAMKLIDELALCGGRPYNFLDLRGGQMKGDPKRLVQVFEWFAAAPSVRVILMNLFAGLSNMADFARLFLIAKAQVPQLRVPFVARLDGLFATEARAVFETDPDIVFEPDLDQAIARAIAIARAGGNPATPGAHHGA